MNPILQDLSEVSMIHAIEANSREFLLTLGRLGGGVERNEPEIQWIIGGAPISYHNCIVRANLTSDRVDEVIHASLYALRDHKVPGSWHVGPSMCPSDLGKHLLAHGFSFGGSEPGMAVDMWTLPAQVPVAPGFAVERIRDGQGLQVWTRTLAQGFGEGEIEANWVGQMYHQIGWSDTVSWSHYLGRWYGEPVATTSLFLGAGVAGIYFVFTKSSARRQGFGAAITLAALRDARQFGYRIGVLGSSPLGYPVYKRLGFREYCHIDLYEHCCP